MKNLLLALSIVAVLFTGCKKEEDNNEPDWTSSLAGLYTHDVVTGGTTYHEITTFTVTPENNKTLNIKIDRDGAGSFVTAIHSCLDSVVLSSSTVFTINETDSCHTAWGGEYWAITGSGSFTPNSITIEWTETRD